MILPQILGRHRQVLLYTLMAICGATALLAAPVTSPPASPDLAVIDANTNIEELQTKPAADIDGHIIKMGDVILSCLRFDRSYVIDQMIQNYVLHRECVRRSIVVSDAEIDKQIEQLRKSLVPASLEETLKQHHATINDVRSSFRHEIEQTMLVADSVKPCKMLHCQQIVIHFGSDPDTGSTATIRQESEALALANDISNRLRQGEDFHNLAALYNEGSGSNDKADLGILYENMLGLVEAPVLKTALTLRKGEISNPVETDHAFHILRALSSGDDHPPDENALYKAADQVSRNLQIRFLGPAAVVKLIDQSTIIHLKDVDLIPGKPLSDVAATVDGHIIPMREVLAKILPATGRKRLDILIQNYVVNRECERRGILVSETEINGRIADLRKQIAPLTLDEGLAQHHTTIEGLRHDFQQEIQRTKLVIDDVPATKSAHTCVIFVRTDSNESPETKPLPRHTDAEAKMLISDLQRQLRAGTDFSDLAKRRSEMNNKGDMGILYEGKRDVDTVILRTALEMKKGEVSPDPIKTYNGYFLLQVLSTGDSHAADEDKAYHAAISAYRQERAQSLIPRAILELVKNSKVIYYLQS